MIKNNNQSHNLTQYLKKRRNGIVNFAIIKIFLVWMISILIDAKSKNVNE